MADITMCINSSCPLARTCYRWRATSGMLQSRYKYRFITDAEGVSCDSYISIVNRRVAEVIGPNEVKGSE